MGSIDVELQVEALAQHIAQTLNTTCQAIIFLMDETTQMQKVVLQSHMALNLLTAAQGGTCALPHAECGVYIPDHAEQAQVAIQEWMLKSKPSIP